MKLVRNKKPRVALDQTWFLSTPPDTSPSHSAESDGTLPAISALFPSEEQSAPAAKRAKLEEADDAVDGPQASADDFFAAVRRWSAQSEAAQQFSGTWAPNAPEATVCDAKPGPVPVVHTYTEVYSGGSGFSRMRKMTLA